MKIHSHISNFILFLVLLASTTSFLLGNTDVRIMQFEKMANNENEKPDRRIKALKNMLKYNNLSHDSALTYFRIGAIYRDYGDFREAIRNFEKGKSLVAADSLKQYLRACLNL